MTERLDRIEALLEGTGQKLNQAAEQQNKNTEGIEDLLGAIAQTDRQVQDLRGESADAKQRFEVLRAEAQNDRNEYRALFNDAITEIKRQQTDWQTKFDSQQAVIERLLLSLLDRADAQERLQARVTRLEQAS